MFGLVFACLVAGALAQSTNLEERVFEDISKMWEIMPKDYIEDTVTIFDLNEFFSKYDPEGGDEWSVGEDAFAAGFCADIGCEENEGRAFFKKFDFTRYDLEFPALEEVIDAFDTAYALQLCDLNLDGVIEQFEFELGFGFTASDLQWGTMFMNYRSLASVPPYYDDHLSFNVDLDGNSTDEGDWQKLFDDIDADSDGFFTLEEFTDFYVGNGYGLESTALLFFLRADVLGNGAVDRTFAWTTVFVNLQLDDIADQLSFDEFVYLDFYVRPVMAEKRAKFVSGQLKEMWQTMKHK